jgi:hypothetical protein
MMRVCKKCGESKPINEFAQHKVFQGNDYVCFSCKYKMLTKYRRRYESKNRCKISEKSRVFQLKGRRELADFYVVDTLHRSTGLSQATIWEHPDLIDAKRLQMKLIRLNQK